MGFKDKKKSEAGQTASAPEAGAVRDADFSALDGAEQAHVEDGNPASQDGSTAPGAADSEISKLRAEVEDNKDKYLRALAEFENYKKRTLKERSELLKYQGERIVFDLLEVLDNLEWALAHPTADAENLRSGLEMIHKIFVDVLGRWEIRPASALGREFDPSQHQAISKVVVDDSKPGTVLNELKKAYFYKDKLLRPGDVVVAVDKEQAGNAGAAQAGDEAASRDEDSPNSQ